MRNIWMQFCTIWHKSSMLKKFIYIIVIIYFAVMIPFAGYHMVHSIGELLYSQIKRKEMIDALVYIITPGLFWNWVLIKYVIFPWQATLIVLSVILISALSLSLITRHVLIKLTCVSGVLACAIQMCLVFNYRNISDEIHDEAYNTAFIIARYIKVDSEYTRRLAFIAQQHIADLIYYNELDAEIGNLTADGYQFFYEDATATKVRSHITLADDLNTYQRPWSSFFLYLLHQPDGGWWPSGRGKEWVAVDLPSNTPSLNALSDLNDNDFRKAVMAMRDQYLLDRINDPSSPRKLAVVYGANHFLHLRDRLVASGWIQDGSDIVRPTKRAIPELSDY